MFICCCRKGLTEKVHDNNLLSKSHIPYRDMSYHTSHRDSSTAPPPPTCRIRSGCGCRRRLSPAGAAPAVTRRCSCRRQAGRTSRGRAVDRARRTRSAPPARAADRRMQDSSQKRPSSLFVGHAAGSVCEDGGGEGPGLLLQFVLESARIGEVI